jgi:hypothetical protein
MKDNYKVYASVYSVPNAGHVKADLILLLDKKGKLVESLPGPVTIAPLVQRLTQKFAKECVQSAVENWFEVEVGLDSIKLASYERLTKMLFKLENK